jgi:hypothetical protein
MAYETIERLLSRRGEKVAAFLTVENAVGIAVCAGPIFAIGEMPLALRAVAVALGAALGVLITLETGGMMLCERVLWRLRGEARLLIRGRALSPDDLPGTRSVAHSHRAVGHGGIVRKSRRQRAEAGVAVRARALAPQPAALVREQAIQPVLPRSEAQHADHPA